MYSTYTLLWVRKVHSQKCPLVTNVDTNALQLSLCGSASLGKMCTVEYWSTPQQPPPLASRYSMTKWDVFSSAGAMYVAVGACQPHSCFSPPHYETSTIWYWWAGSANKHVHCTGAVPHYIHTYVHNKLPPHQLSLTQRAPSFSPSSPDVGNSKDPSHVLHEDDARRAEVGGEWDVEPSIAIHQSGVAAVQCNALHHNQP